MTLSRRSATRAGLVGYTLGAALVLGFGCSSESTITDQPASGGRAASSGGATASSGGASMSSGGATATSGGATNGGALSGVSGAAPTSGGTSSGGAATSGGALTTLGGASAGGGAAGAAGQASAGTAGATASGGAGGVGGATPTLGCGMPAGQALGSFVQHTLDVAGSPREYFVYLPQGYDPTRAYPVVFQFHGAGGTGKSNNVPIEKSSGQNAIVVGGTAQINTSENRTQWQFNSSTSPDVAFFDAMVTAVSSAYCVDKSRLFATGFSSGSWMCHVLGCVRPTVLRAYGVVSGGLPGGARNCAAEGIAARFIHDSNDTENVISGGQAARDRLLKVNGCGATTAPDEPSPCVRYQGCREGLPVDWCQTSGQGHNVQASLSGPAFWRFFGSF